MPKQFYQPKSKRAQNQIWNARLILVVEGARQAAAFLRREGWSVEAALFILFGK